MKDNIDNINNNLNLSPSAQNYQTVFSPQTKQWETRQTNNQTYPLQTNIQNRQKVFEKTKSDKPSRITKSITTFSKVQQRAPKYPQNYESKEAIRRSHYKYREEEEEKTGSIWQRWWCILIIVLALILILGGAAALVYFLHFKPKLTVAEEMEKEESIEDKELAQYEDGSVQDEVMATLNSLTNIVNLNFTKTQKKQVNPSKDENRKHLMRSPTH